MKQNSSGFPWGLLLLVVAAIGVWRLAGMPLPNFHSTAPAAQVQQPPIEVVVVLPTPAPAVEQAQEFQSAPAADASMNDGSQDHTAASSGDAGVDSGVTVLGGQNQITVNNAAGTEAQAADTSGAAAANASVDNTAGQSAVAPPPPSASAPGPDVNVRFWARDVTDVSAAGLNVWIFDWKGSQALVHAQGDTDGHVRMAGINGAYISACWINPVGTVFTWGNILTDLLTGDIRLTMRSDYSECPNPTWVP